MTSLRDNALPLVLLAVGAAVVYFGWQSMAGDLGIEDGTIQGDGFTFMLPAGFTDGDDHPGLDGTAQLSQIQRNKGVVAVGEKGKRHYPTVGVIPLGSTEEVDASEQMCKRMASRMRASIAPSRSRGAKGMSVEQTSFAFPGSLPQTDCTFSLAAGDEYYAKAAIFSHRDTVYAATCESESSSMTDRMCSDLFESMILK